MGASYSLISEGHLKKDFARQMATSIDSRMVKIQLDSTILAAGLSKIIPSFSHHELHGRLEQSSTVKMVVMRNDTYFRDYRDAIRDRIQHSSLDLHVLMPDPRDRGLMAMLAKRYDVYNADQLTASVQKSIQDWLQGAVYDRLTGGALDRLHLYFGHRVPFYSAYLFDSSELWYIPYHMRKGRQMIPVFVYRELQHEPPIYKDLIDLFDNSTEHPLGEPLSIGTVG